LYLNTKSLFNSILTLKTAGYSTVNSFNFILRDILKNIKTIILRKTFSLGRLWTIQKVFNVPFYYERETYKKCWINVLTLKYVVHI